jgi:hypothetical protein
VEADSALGGIGLEIRSGVAKLECHLTPPFISCGVRNLSTSRTH